MGGQLGGGGPPRKKKSCSEFAETCSRFGIFEIRQYFFPKGGGGQKKKVVQNLLKHALVLEFLKSGNIFFRKGGVKKKKLFRIC